MLINLNVNPEVRARNIQLCREKGILLPTFKQMMDPSKVPASVKAKLAKINIFFGMTTFYLFACRKYAYSNCKIKNWSFFFCVCRSKIYNYSVPWELQKAIFYC